KECQAHPVGLSDNYVIHFSLTLCQIVPNAAKPLQLLFGTEKRNLLVFLKLLMVITPKMN
ncbi:MAG: hypothetical protein IKB98_03975, partial [Clostridia bacterium]|nr:hypothetical protein [Clostridia bacterium]